MEGSFLGALREAAESPKVPLADKPGTNNWVEKYNALGGKGNWIRRTAEHLKGKGKADGHAIAIAVNAARKYCASGDLNFPGVQQGNAAGRAEACTAVAVWDKAKAQARTARVSESELRAYDAAGVSIRRTAERLMELGAEPEAALDGAVTLCEVYVPGSFDPNEHPRDWRGKFRKAVGQLAPGEQIRLPDGVSVTKVHDSHYVVRRSGDTNRSTARTPEGATALAVNKTSAGKDTTPGVADSPGESAKTIARNQHYSKFDPPKATPAATLSEPQRAEIARINREIAEATSRMNQQGKSAEEILKALEPYEAMKRRVKRRNPTTGAPPRAANVPGSRRSMSKRFPRGS